MEKVQEIKEKILQGMKILLRDGMMELNTGHLASRIPGEEKFITIGHLHDFGRTLDTLTLEDLITLDMEGNKLEGKLNTVGELPIHTEIFKRRPDVGAIIHAHPKLATCFSIAGTEILPVYHRAAILSPKVPIWDYPGQVNNLSIAGELAKALGKLPAILMRGHGIVTVGANIEECVSICCILERNAEMQLIATAVGTPRSIEAKYLDGRHIIGQKHENWVRNIWGFLAHQYLK